MTWFNILLLHFTALIIGCFLGFLLVFLLNKVRVFIFDNTTMIVKCFENRMEYQSQTQLNDIDSKFKEIKIELYHLQSMILKSPPEEKKPHQKGGNRKKRSQEERVIASKQRKQWWEKQRGQPEIAPSEEHLTQPQVEPIPPVSPTP